MALRNCCCCRVTTAAVILGLLALILSVLVTIPLASYWAHTDIPGLAVLRENQKILEKVLEDSLRSHTWTRDNTQEILNETRAWFPTAVQVATCYAGATALGSFMLVLGVCCEVRCLLVPFLILSMIDIVLSGTVGVVVVVAMFYLATVPGVVSAVVYVTLAVVSLYCWAIVLSAYKQLGQAAGQAGYVYSPVSAAKEMPPYYPSAPQYFVMEEYGGNGAGGQAGRKDSRESR